MDWVKMRSMGFILYRWKVRAGLSKDEKYGIDWVKLKKYGIDWVQMKSIWLIEYKWEG